MRRENEVKIRVVGLLFFVAACGDVDAQRQDFAQSCVEGSQPFQLGHGLDQFNVPEVAQELWFEPGIQGGYHVWAGVRIGKFDPISTHTQFRLYSDEALVGGRTVPATYTCANVGYQLLGVPVELYFHRPPQQFDQTQMLLKAILTEQDGTIHEDEFTFRARCCRGYE